MGREYQDLYIRIGKRDIRIVQSDFRIGTVASELGRGYHIKLGWKLQGLGSGHQRLERWKSSLGRENQDLEGDIRTGNESTGLRRRHQDRELEGTTELERAQTELGGKN